MVFSGLLGGEKHHFGSSPFQSWRLLPSLLTLERSRVPSGRLANDIFADSPRSASWCVLFLPLKCLVPLESVSLPVTWRW